MASNQRTTYQYDSAGIRVSALLETDTNLDGAYDTSVLTQFLIDPQNPTGYSQVLRQTTTDQSTSTPQIQKVVVYTIGASLISQTTTPYTSGVAGTPQTLVFGYDGHGSVRVLLDMAAAIATVASIQQLFHYDAHGNLLNIAPAQAATAVLYSSQMLDPSTGLYYNRARWYDPQSGRFDSLDPFFGNLQDPLSLHKYLYGASDPVNNADPSGEFWLSLAYFGLIGGVLGGVGTILSNYAAGNDPLHNIGYGIAFGAIALPLSLAYGWIGLGVAGYCMLASSALTYEVWTNPNSTLSQKGVALGLFVVSAFGMRSASANIRAHGWGYNPSAFEAPVVFNAVNPKIGEILEGVPENAMMHVTPIDPALIEASGGVKPGSHWARVGDVPGLTEMQYKNGVAGPGVPGGEPNAVWIDVVVPENQGSLPSGFTPKPSNNQLGVQEYTNDSPRMPDVYGWFPSRTE